MVEFFTVGFIILGGILITGVKPPKIQVGLEFRKLASKLDHKKRDVITAKDYIHRLNGTKKESFTSRSFRDAEDVYMAIGQSEGYQRVLQLALLCALGGFFAGGLILGNWLIGTVLGIGLYFLPLWVSQFSLYRYEQIVSIELETALNLITASYLRTQDFLKAVEENLPHINEPIVGIFSAYCNTLNYIDPNAPAALEQMRGKTQDIIFLQWIDAVILCQENHLLQGALPTIVSKFSDLKAQRESNKTRMMLPLQNAVGMICLVASYFPLMWMVNENWFFNLTQTLVGQISIVCTIIAIFVSLNKAIRISKPLSYGV